MIHSTINKIEDSICTLNGVVSAHVVLSLDDLEIEEVHVVATQDRSPKRIVRDIESLLLSNSGIKIDHKKISIAQVHIIKEEVDPGPDDSAVKHQKTERIQFVSAKSTTYGLRWEVSVELERGGIPSIATANGAGSRQNISRLVAQATAEALNNYLGENQAVAIDEVLTIEGVRHKTIIVILALLTGGGEKVLVGSSIVEDDQPRAVVHATLDAINRAMT